jgi:hypothetical protein
VRQGPGYPRANEFTGQREVSTGSADTQVAEPETGADPEATYGGPAFAHGRGNQGMRRQK